MVIAVIAVLIAILLPALSKIRSQGRLTQCISNIRGQTHLVLAYANDFKDALPPRSVFWNRLEDDDLYHQTFWTLPRFMALRADQPFPQVGNFFPPTGIWRCPEIRTDQDEEFTTHASLVHSAANTWVYTSAIVDDESGDRSFSDDALPGWEPVVGHGWRKLSQFGRPADLVAIGDSITFWFALHGHRHARESYGMAWQIVPGGDTDNRGTHPGQRLPAGFLDGHAASPPIGADYWQNGQHDYATPGGGAPTTLSTREAEKLVWYVR